MNGFEFQGLPIDAVIFDHDGVLVDSELIAMEIITQLLNENGIKSTVSEAFNYHLGRGFESVTERLVEVNPEFDPINFAAEFHRTLFTAFENSLMSISGIAALLETLRDSGIPLAIGSSGTRERVNLGIGLTALGEYFPSQYIFTREDVSRGKPDPDIFLLAATRLGISPTKCLVIEDSPHGVTAAKRAGMKVIGLTLRTNPELLTSADALVTEVDQILKLISDTTLSKDA